MQYVCSCGHGNTIILGAEVFTVARALYLVVYSFEADFQGETRVDKTRVEEKLSFYRVASYREPLCCVEKQDVAWIDKNE